MSNRLSLLIGDFSGSDAKVASVLAEWSSAGLLGTVAWVSTDAADQRPRVTVSESSRITEQELFGLLTSRIWSQVTVVGVRQEKVERLSQERFEHETRLLTLVQRAFEAHPDLEFQSFTVSIAEETGLVARAFSNAWKMHILHEPIVRIDRVVASQPMWDDHRHLLVLLLALTMAGGFVWQVGALAPEMADQVSGLNRPIRVGRSYLRVVSAGRLTDDVLAGAFPKSGPWSIPPDVPNALAVPPGSAMNEGVVEAIKQSGGFVFRPWKTPAKDHAKQMKIFEGIKLYLKEFGDALKQIPIDLAGIIRADVEAWVQKTTFGSNSSILLKFSPGVDDLNPDELVAVIRNLQLDGSSDPVVDVEPWLVLQRTALGAVDGGQFPSNVPVPVSGANRLVYTDPVSIGPAPDDSSFEVTKFEAAVLKLDERQHLIGPMAVDDALTLQAHLEAVQLELATRPLEATPTNTGSRTAKGSPATASATKPQKRLGWFKRWRQRRKEKKARKKAPVALPVPTPAQANDGQQSLSTEVPGATTTSQLSESAAQSPVVATEPTAGEAASVADDDQRHTPSHPDFNPSEYTPLGVFYQGDRPEMLQEFAEANRVHGAAQTSYPSISGRYSRNQSCDHCGTPFDHGVVYLHEPTKKLVHVGHICARATLPMPSEIDLVATRLADLESRFAEWLSRRSGSLLWRVGESIVRGIVGARLDLAACLELLGRRPQMVASVAGAYYKFGKWTRRGVMSILLVIAAALASVVLTPLPLLLTVLIVTAYFSAFIIRILYLARDIVRERFKLRVALDEYERAYLRARHDVSEIVRLSSIRDQFSDWQVVLREIVHLPFGREVGFGAASTGIEEVTRPPAMILGKSKPDDRQKMQLFLNARRQAIHSGWLLEILDMLKEEWRKDYENARLTTPADNILPEADNAPAGSVVGKRPLTDDNVYYPRTDFRRRVTAGDLQKALVIKKAEQVAGDLRQTSLDRLLAAVEVSGLGSALSGQSVADFLAGLSSHDDAGVNFPPDLIADSYPNNRLYAPELVLPPPGSLNADAGQIQVQPGVELTAAAWRVELSAPIHPLEILKGYQAEDSIESESVVPDEPSTA
jgi:hypothetical protein